MLSYKRTRTAARYLKLADQQTIRIEPRRSWLGLDLKEIWAYRELLYFLTWRDVKVRYKQTAIGVSWAVLQPVITTVIFSVLFSNFARFDTGDIPYPPFVLTGLLVWLFVHTSVTMASNSFVSNVNLVTKVYFPRLIVPVAATIAGVFDLIFSAVLLALLLLYFRVIPGSQAVFAPLFIVLAVIQTAAVGVLFAALNVRYRDVKFGLPFLLQIWMIASPVFYPTSILSDRWKMVFAINPLTGIIEGLRSSLFQRPFDPTIIAVSSVSAFVLCAIALTVFNRMEDDFADVI